VTEPIDEVRQSYDRIAEAYAERYGDELRHKSLDLALLRALLDERPAECGAVADVGCGPGHITRHLQEHGADIVGIDVSAAMLDVARRRNPGITFRQGSLLKLGVPDSSFSAIVAFYSIIHVPRERLRDVLRECARALCSGGPLLISFHVGSEDVHAEEMLGQRVSLDFHFYEMSEVSSACAEAGLSVELMLQRRPYAPMEAPTTRGYLLARKG
jgi:ubiquinone/menaquinone biosynthesis C-methylase UbiE